VVKPGAPISPLPCTFPASRSSIPMNHTLPPKPPISMHFHRYTPPTRKPATTLRDLAAQDVDHGKPIPVNYDPEKSLAHHHATASSIGVLSGPHIDSVSCPSREGSCGSTSSCCPSVCSPPFPLFVNVGCHSNPPSWWHIAPEIADRTWVIESTVWLLLAPRRVWAEITLDLLSIS
jgi:hypothetical protein